jgi:iron-sulfur cluster assembly protein
MAVTLSEAAARHVTRYIAKRGKGVGVRLGIKTTGCSGLAYKLEYADDIAPEDHVFEEHGVKVLVDPKSLPYIDGTQLDFVREGLNEGFKFHNPREKDRCGCGESFRVCRRGPSGGRGKARRPELHCHVPLAHRHSPRATRSPASARPVGGTRRLPGDVVRAQRQLHPR